MSGESSGFLLPDEELRLQSGSAVRNVEPAANSSFLLPGEQTAQERAVPVLREAVAADPEKAARVRTAAQTTGIPEPVVERNFDRVQSEAKLRDLADLIRTSPVLARQLSDPAFAKIAHDDVENLAMIVGILAPPKGPERAVTSDEFARMVVETRKRNPGMDWDMARASVNARVVVDNSPGGITESRGPAPSFSMIAAGLGKGAVEGGFTQAIEGARQWLGDLFGFETVSKDAARKSLQSQNRVALATPEIDSTTGRDVYQGAQSTLQVLPGIIVGLATANPALGLALLGAQTATPAYSKYKNRGGSTGEASLGAVLEGGAEVAGELLPMSFMVKKLGRAGMAEFVTGMLGREIPSEIATTIAQTATDTAVANPTKTWEQWAGELPAEIRSTVTGVLVQASLFAGAHKGVGVLGGRAQEAENNGFALENLLKVVEASKVIGRDAQAFEQFMGEVANDGPVQDIYVPAAVFAQAAGDNLDVFMQAMPSVAAQMDAALVGNSDLVIPIGEFAANVPGTGMEAKLIEHARTSIDGMSQADAKVFMQGQAEEFRKATEEQLAKVEVTDAIKESSARVENEIFKQLEESGRFTKDVNAAYAMYSAAFFTTTAARRGITPEEAFKQFSIRVSNGEKAKTTNSPAPGEPPKRTLLQRAADAMGLGEKKPAVVNIGLNVNDGTTITPDEARAALKAAGVDIQSDAVHQSNTEQTLVAKINRPLTEKEATDLSAALRQEAIAQHDGTTGELYGPGAEAWRPFNPEYFLGLDGKPMSVLNQDAAPDNFGMNPEQLAVSIAPWIYGQYAPFTGLKTVRELGEVLQDVIPQRTAFTDENLEFLSSVIAKEVEIGLAKGMGGPGWYSHTLEAALDIAALTYPEIKTDPDKRFAFTYALAVTSNGQTVPKNYEYAMEVYGRYAETGKMTGFYDPVKKRVTGYGVRGDIMLAAFHTFNEITKEIGVARFREFLLTKHPVHTLNMVAGRALKEMVDQELYGGSIIGPKIGGGFLQNINGNHDALTLDVWMYRMWGRITGDILSDRINPKTGQRDMLKETTDSGEKRAFIRDTFETALGKLQERGHDLAMDDMQALLWYAEKTFYTVNGVNDEEGKGYDNAAATWAEERGIKSPLVDSVLRPGLDGGRTASEQPGAAGAVAQTATGERTFEQSRRPGRGTGLREAQALAVKGAAGVAPLNGLPSAPLQVNGDWYVPGPVGVAHDAAVQYMLDAGLPYLPNHDYAKIDRDRAKRIAKAFDEMKHAPNDPEVRAAYRAMIDETIAQWQAIKATGLKVEFIDFAKQGDPYASTPRGAIIDVRDNNHLWVFPTDAGFGSDGTDVSGNPLLEFTDEVIDGRRLRANDVFRIVHDYFGHIKDGNGFRAGGEENAWRSHSAMYSPLARRAMTTETRGQNSWVNFGPYGEANQKASAADTHYAPQKIGLLPEWVSEEGRQDAQVEYPGPQFPAYGQRQPGSISVVGVHFSTEPRHVLDSSKYGTGMRGAERDNLMHSSDTRLRNAIFFYVNEGKGVSPESGVGSVAHVVRLNNLYDATSDPLEIWRIPTVGGNPTARETAVLDAGFDGYYARGVFGNHGAVVLLGPHSVPVTKVGFEYDANEATKDFLPPPEYVSARKALAREIRDLKGVPMGQLTPAEWKAEFERVAPDLLARIPPEAFEGNEPVYRDGLIRKFYQGDKGSRGSIAFGADITQQTTVINLLKNADLSTFLHEMGHFQLEVLSHIASQPNAPAEIVDDMNKALRWFGVPDLETWNAMPLEEKRTYHEKWARGMEAYLFEGKAPNPELNGVFARFRAWMIRVYRDLTGLNVTLSDEVRGVFDRLVATNEQILQAEQERSYAPLFKSAEEMGATPEEWAAYQALGQEATQAGVDHLQAASLRDMAYASNARARAIRALQKEAKEKRAAVEAEVAAEVNAMPIYRARAFLTHGILDGEQKVGAKLNLESLKKMYGTEPNAPWRYFNTGPNGMVAANAESGGVNPGLIAEMFGFTSGDQLVRELLAADPPRLVIQGLTDQRMLERYGDLTDEQSIARAADAAVHNDVRARFIATELRALGKAVGSPKIMTKAAKAFAEQIIARKRVRDIKPNQYSVAETRAAKAAQKTSNLVEKATEKRNQLVNHYAARAAYDALDEAAKIQRYLKKFDNESTRKAIDIDHLDQIDAILERFDLRQMTNKAADKRASLAAWITKQEAVGIEPVIPDEIRNEAFRKPFKEMTIEEIRGLYDSIRNIEHIGRRWKELFTAKDKREFEAVVADMSASIRTNATGTVAERRVSDRGFLVAAGNIFKGFFAAHRKFASLAREMDGWKDAGVMWERLVWGMNDAGNAEAVAREKATIKLTELLAPVLKAGPMNEKKYFPTSGKSFTREERIGLLLNMGNDVNKERVVNGEHLTEAALAEVFATLSPQDAAFVQAVWDYLDTFRPAIGAKERRLTGVEPDWVEPTPVTIVTNAGPVTLKGGYYPIKYDPIRSERSHADSAAEVQKQLERGLYTRAQTRRGHIKERVESTGRPLRLDFGNVLASHVDQVVHDLSWHEYLIDANRLLRAPQVESAIREHYGHEKLRELKNTLTDIAVGDMAAQSSLDTVLNHLRHGATVAGLGWRVTTSLLQPLGLTQSIVRIGAANVLRGAWHWAGDAASLENSNRIIGEKSEFMRLRAKTMQREINEIRNKVTDKDSRIEASYFYLIQKMQLVADIPTWWGEYERVMKLPDMTEEKAIALADQAVRDAQGHGQIGDLASIQRGHAGLKLFTNFYSFFNTTYNLTRESFGRTRSLADVPMLAADLLLLYSVPAILGTVLKAALGGDWEDPEKVKRKLIADQLNYLLGTVVVLREVGSATQSALGLTGDYTGPASVRFFADLAKFAKQANQGEADEAFWKALNNVGGAIFHYPSGQINATLDGIDALASGKTKNPGALLVGSNKN